MQVFTKNRIVRLVIPIATVAFVIFALKFNDFKSKNIESNIFQERFGPIMGTSGYVKIIPSSSMKSSAQDIFNAAYSKTKHAESILSRYNPESDISKINNAKPGEKIKITPLTWRVLLESRRFFQLSNGAFDPSIGAIIDVYPWVEKEVPSLPKQEVIDTALAKSGFDKIHFEREGMYIYKTTSGVILDLGGIAKGLGVHIFAETLKESGVENAIVEIGGEISIIGKPEIEQKTEQIIGSKHKIWSTGIKNPRGKGIIKKLESEGGVSIATSGDYEKYFLVDGKRYSHILDPKTGYPTSGGIISATVVTKRSCTIADALATSITVLGVEESRKLLKLFTDTTAYLILDDMSEITVDGGLMDNDALEVMTK